MRSIAASRRRLSWTEGYRIACCSRSSPRRASAPWSSAPDRRGIRLEIVDSSAYLTAMAVKTILTAPDPRLKKKSKPVASVDADVRRLMDDMLETMYAAPGIGLAAPQVGE